jgi:alpha-glucosidase
MHRTMRNCSSYQPFPINSVIALCAALLLPPTVAWPQSHPAASPRETRPAAATAQTNETGNPVFAWSQESPAVLSSPDGKLALGFQTNGDGHLTYTVTFQGKPVLEPSGLGLDLQGQSELGSNVHIVNATGSEADENYRLVTGKTDSVTNHYRALVLDVEENAAPQRRLQIEARAYNDAVAFRYVIPEQEALDGFQLKAEHTEFRLSKDATAYALLLPNYRSMYESEFVKLPVSAFSNQGGVASKVLCGCPMLLELPGVAWMAITEADLRGYSSMYLLNPSGSWTGHRLESLLAPNLADTNLCVTALLPHHSAWRVMLIAAEPAKLIESTVITSLNPESAIADTSWIHAGKASWNWWSGSIGPDGKEAFSTDVMKYYVDFAAKSGFPYMLVDAGWSEGDDITRMNGRADIPEVVRYAAAKNVKVWIWLSYRSVVLHMADAFPLFEKWGVAGVKIDFIERDDQGGIEWYYRTAQSAAQHHLMVDFHGATKPSGIERTWPNVLGYEAVAGMEQSKAGARDNPDHRVTLPFTRMLAGAMDYTPGGFDNVTREAFEPRMIRPMVMGTRAQQLAMYVVYLAPFQMVSDCPSAYEGQPEFQFIKDVPATWDETRALGGLPGEYVVIARRSGNEWFLGAMTGWTQRELDLPLDFLGAGRYTAEIYGDSKDAGQFPQHVSIEKKTVKRTSRLDLQLAPGGGCAVRFVPKT